VAAGLVSTGMAQAMETDAAAISPADAATVLFKVFEVASDRQRVRP
jgi:hypothetical protein